MLWELPGLRERVVHNYYGYSCSRSPRVDRQHGLILFPGLFELPLAAPRMARSASCGMVMTFPWLVVTGGVHQSRLMG